MSDWFTLKQIDDRTVRVSIPSWNAPGIKEHLLVVLLNAPTLEYQDRQWGQLAVAKPFHGSFAQAYNWQFSCRFLQAGPAAIRKAMMEECTGMGEYKVDPKMVDVTVAAINAARLKIVAAWKSQNPDYKPNQKG